MIFSLVRSLIKNRGLLFRFIVRSVELRSKGNHLGLVWSVLSPLTMLALYIFVFGYIFGGKFGVLPNESSWDYGLGVFVGLAMFNMLADLLSISPNIIFENVNLVKKVVFPLEVLPAVAVGAAVFNLLVTMMLVLAGIIFFGRGVELSVLFLPVLFVPFLLFSLGCAYFMAAISVFIPDVRQVLPVVTTALMFASAVFYPLNKIPAGVWSVLKFNPVLHFVDAARHVVLWGALPGLNRILYLYLVSVAAFSAGTFTFQLLKRHFSEVL